MNLLRFSIHCVILSSGHDGIVIVLSCSSSGIHCFLMISLPLSFDVFLASRVIHSCKVMENFHRLESGFDPLYCFSIRSKTNATRAEGQFLRYVLQAGTALDGSGYLSQLVQLNVALFVNCATRELHGVSGFPKSSTIDLALEPCLDFPPLLEFVPFSVHLPRSHLVQFPNSEVDFKFTLFFLNK